MPQLKAKHLQGPPSKVIVRFSVAFGLYAQIAEHGDQVDDPSIVAR